MIMIIFHHFAIHGGFEYESTTLSIPRFWYNLIFMGGKIGVNLFVLITGYFLIENTATSTNLRKIIKLWGQLLFYSVILYIGREIIVKDFSIRKFLKCFTPITTRKWWFASTYFVLYLIHPYLNLLLHSMEKKTYQRYLLLLLFCWCVIPTFFQKEFEGNNLLWFITLYSLSGYLKLFGLNQSLSNHSGRLTVIFFILTYVFSIGFTILGTKWEIFVPFITDIYDMNQLTTLLISVCMFTAFSNIKVKYNKWINLISSATFGVYLIHDNGNIRPLLWEKVFHNAGYQDSIILIPYSFAAVIIVFAICSLIELLRQMTIERIYMRIVNRTVENVSLAIQKAGQFLQKLIF